MKNAFDTSRWKQLGALFDQAIGLEPAEQAELLRSTEREDAELAQALASLLEADARHHARTSEHRERVLQDSLAAIEAPAVVVGDRVGPYILREELGHGGMGVVFRAERVDGQVQQEVALKIVKRALLDASGRERFLREREIVAAFQHPYIARMLDVGQTADGSPYLAMELIRGQTITGWCDAHKLATGHRVRLFLRVCEAVQHAHANLVLHRDLKPSNVLVGKDGLPKLIDFGIAKPLAIAEGDEHQQTATADRFFSPSNVAPEQLRGDRVGVACDVYQLGTLLYELLCGAKLFDATGLTPGQFEQRILEAAPDAPSARAACVNDESAQAHGAASAAALEGELRGDLDAIVALALRKTPGERYGSVEQLGDDLRRFLDELPVTARRGQRWYRASKFLRRNALVIGVSTAAVALVAVFVTALWLQSQRIARERNLAQQRANDLVQVARFEADMLKQVNPAQVGKLLMADMQTRFASALVRAGVPEAQRPAQAASFAVQLQRVNATDTASDIIDRTTLKPALAAIETQFSNQPLVAAHLRQVVAVRYIDMGMYDAAMPLLQSSLATRRRILGDEHPDTLRTISDMGALLEMQGKLSAAGPYLREAAEKMRHVFGEENKDTRVAIENLGELLQHQGKVIEAMQYFREALEISRRVDGDQSASTLELVGVIGVALESQGKPSEAEPYLREAVKTLRRVRGKDDSLTQTFVTQLGWTLQRQGKLGEAEPYVREALEKSRRDFGEEHPRTLDAINLMGKFLQDQGKLSDAEGYFREVLDKRRRVQGEQDTDTLLAIGDLGTDLEAEGKLGEAERYLREALETSRRTRGEKNWATVGAVARMGDLLVAQGKYAEAEKLLVPIEAEARKPHTLYQSYVRALILMSLGRASAGLGDFAAAEAGLLEAQPILFETEGPTDIGTRKCTQALVDLYTSWNTAGPGKGYDAKAAEWKRKLTSLDASVPAEAVH